MPWHSSVGAVQHQLCSKPSPAAGTLRPTEPALGASSAGLEGTAASGRVVGGQTALIMPATLR